MTNWIVGLIWGRAIPFLLGSLSNDDRAGNENVKKAIDYFRIPHNTLRLLPQMLQRLLFANALGKMQYSQEHLKTMVYAKFGGQTESIKGDSKIENRLRLCANGRNNSQHCCANSVGSCCVRVGTGVQTDATTPNKFGTCSASWEGYNP